MRRQMVFDHTGCLEMLDLRLSLSLSGVSGGLLAPSYGTFICADDPTPTPESSPGSLPTDPTSPTTTPTSGPAGPGTS
ncbi:MAG: hypothetical protein ACYC61_29030 [Isosphaeraceae bacterium]